MSDPSNPYAPPQSRVEDTLPPGGPQVSPQTESLLKGRNQIIWSFLVVLIGLVPLAALALLLPYPTGLVWGVGVFAVAAVVATILEVLSLWYMGRGLNLHPAVCILLIVGSFVIPGVGLALPIALFIMATNKLKAAGYRVSLFSLTPTK